jgi:WD40 repeat protein
MIDNMDFDTRAIIQGKSFDSQLLVLDFQDNDIISLAYLLETPIEVTTIEWHPENAHVLVGGCLNGQIIVWDLSAKDYVINTGSKKSGGGGGDDDGPSEQVSEEKAQFMHMKHLCHSVIQQSHKAFVADLGFVPPSINVDKRAPSEGKHTHLISVSEDGIVNLWDTRTVDKDALKAAVETQWRPFLRLDLFKQDGSGELGLSRILLQKGQTTPTFWALSDEGDLVLIDWSIKPI